MTTPTTWRYVMSVEELAGEEVWSIRSLYTGPDGAVSWSKEPARAQGSTWMECYDDLCKMTRAAPPTVLDLRTDPPGLRQLEIGRKEGRR